MKIEATNEHRWLQKLVGRWVGEGEAQMGPEAPPEKWKIPEQVSQVGDVWVQRASFRAAGRRSRS